LISTELAHYIEQTLLKHDADYIDIDELCAGAVWFGFAGVCVFPEHLPWVSESLVTARVKTVTVANFPSGDQALQTVLADINASLISGADEIDYVMNLPAALSADWNTVAADIRAVVELVHAQDKLVKIILETCLLNEQQKLQAAQIARTEQADFVKTSTGFSTGGATVEDVVLLHNAIGQDIGIKASGGISDREKAMVLIAAGASRLGTSHGLKIIGH